jgi:hypothetical protein
LPHIVTRQRRKKKKERKKEKSSHARREARTHSLGLSFVKEYQSLKGPRANQLCQPGMFDAFELKIAYLNTLNYQKQPTWSSLISILIGSK